MQPLTNQVHNSNQSNFLSISSFIKNVNHNGRTLTLNPENVKKCAPLFQIFLGLKGHDLQDELFNRCIHMNTLLSLRCSKDILPIVNFRIIQLWNLNLIDMNPCIINFFNSTYKSTSQPLVFKNYFQNLEVLKIVLNLKDKPETLEADVKTALSHLPGLKELSLSCLKQSSISSITTLTQLNSMAFHCCEIENDLFSNISQMTTIKNLDFHFCIFCNPPNYDIDIFDLKPLTQLELSSFTFQSLDYLSESNCEILNTMTSLTSLDLSGKVDNKIKDLTGLKHLSCFSIPYEQLMTMTILNSLNVAWIEEEEAMKYSQLTRLKTLDLSSGGAIKDETLDILKTLPNLEVINPKPLYFSDSMKSSEESISSD